MKILNNAIQAIQIGLEDYKSEDPRRAQSALRNIFAGMLLLFKEQLRRMSPEDSDEVLIKQTISPVLDSDGELSFQGKRKKTVDVQQRGQHHQYIHLVPNIMLLNLFSFLPTTLLFSDGIQQHGDGKGECLQLRCRQF